MASSGFAPPINTSIFIPEVDWQESIHKARPPPRIENFNFAKSAIHSVSRFLIPCHMPFWDWQHKTLYFTLNTFDSMLQKTGSQFFFDAVSRGLTWDRPAKSRSGTASCKHAHSSSVQLFGFCSCCCCFVNGGDGGLLVLFVCFTSCMHGRGCSRNRALVSSEAHYCPFPIGCSRNQS